MIRPWRPVAVGCTLTWVLGCDMETISGPATAPDADLVHLVQAAGLAPGPFAIAEIRGAGYETVTKLVRPLGRIIGPAGPVGSSATRAAVTADLPPEALLFIVNPGGPNTPGLVDSVHIAWSFFCFETLDGQIVITRSLNTTVTKIENTPILNTGGHLSNHPAAKPVGAWEPEAGPLSADARFHTTYRAGPASGDETISLSYVLNDTNCAGIPQTDLHLSAVRVLNLSRVPALPGLTFATITSDNDDVFWGTSETLTRLAATVAAHQDMFGTGLELEAISLPYGGLNDVNANWKTPHQTHRIGTDVDLDGPDDSPSTHANIIRAGRHGGFVYCAAHGGQPGGRPNHVHCYGRRYN